MKREQNSLGVKFNIEVPGTIEEFSKLLPNGQVGVLEYATDEAMFRTVLPKIRTKFFELIKANHSLEPRVKDTKPPTKQGGEPIKVYEKDSHFIKWVAGQVEGGLNALQPLMQQAADSVGFDLTSSGRGGRVATKQDKATAEALIARIVNGESTFDRVVANLQNANNGLEVIREADGSVTVDNLATALLADRKRREADATNNLL